MVKKIQKISFYSHFSPVFPLSVILFALLGLCPLPALEAGLGLSSGLNVSGLEACSHLAP